MAREAAHPEAEEKFNHAVRSLEQEEGIGPTTCTYLDTLGFRCPLLETCPARAPAGLGSPKFAGELLLRELLSSENETAGLEEA